MPGSVIAGSIRVIKAGEERGRQFGGIFADPVDVTITVGRMCRHARSSSGTLDGLQGARTERRRGGHAGALGDQRPGVALIVDLGGRGASRSGAGGAVVLALQR